MSERTKFFADQASQARSDKQQRELEGEAAKKRVEELHETFARAARVYEPLLAKIADELRADGIAATITSEAKVIRAVDAHTREEYGGNVFLTLSFKAGRISYEIVYLGVQQPSVLGMLAWRHDNASTYFVGPQSKTAPAALLQVTHDAEDHVNVALGAMKTG